MSQFNHIPESVKSEAKNKLITLAMKAFRPEPYHVYEKVASAHVETIAKRLAKDFEDEESEISQNHSSLRTAFRAIIDEYESMGELFPIRCPLETQIERMLKTVNADSSMRKVHARVVAEMERQREGEIEAGFERVFNELAIKDKGEK